MKTSVMKKWVMASTLGLTYWFFGNLYEAIVFSPNWVIDSPEQIRRLNEFFILTSPTIYFVPITQLATVVVWVLLWINPEPRVSRELRFASLFALIATIVNVIVVSTAALKLFGTGYAEYGNYLTTLAWRWNFLNLIRMGATGITIYFMFEVFRKLDRKQYAVRRQST